VVRVLRGSAEGSLVLRNIGGTVGDTRIEVEGLEPLERNNLYVFLETVETPTQEGAETALSFVGQQQGIFVERGGIFANGLAARL
jgi:hypothetical protein